MWPSSANCVQSLKSAGYRIAVTDCSEASCTLHEVDMSQPIAFVFGNEVRGVSEEVGEKHVTIVT